VSTRLFKRPVPRSAVVAGAALSSLALFAVSSAPAAFAADEPVDVVNTETVQVYLDSHGEIQSRRVYEQLTLTGEGAVDVANPIEESGLRNLDGFAGFEVNDGVQTVSTDVDGVERLRTVSDYNGDLPLEVSVEYRLDGDLIDPDDLVGEDGALEVTYTVTNVTAQEQEISYADGKGGTVTETAEVPIPMVGSLSTVAPANFTDVVSKQANMAGDGEGGTKMSFTMTLFPPLGSDEVSFGYTANISDGVVPGASITALPINPLESPTFKSAGDSYKSGSETGVRLADGATEIDTNLLRLRDGAGELLAGLIKLSDGADQLNAGLAGEAAPGAERLASGALQLDDGLGQIDDGAGKLADGAGRLRLGAGQLDDGAGKLSAGAGELNAGAKKLRAGAGQLATGTGAAVTGSEKLEGGLKQISDGLGTLADNKSGLPTAVAGVDALRTGVNQILAGFGSTTQDGTLLFGLNSLEAGLTQLEGGATQLVGGLGQLRGDGSVATPGLVGAKGGVDQVKAGLDAALSQAPADMVNPNPDVASLAKLRAGIQSLAANCDVDEPACQPTIDALLAGVDRSRTNLSTAAGGLGQVSGGLATAVGALNTQLIPGAQQIAGGLGTAKAGATRTKAGAVALRDGATQVGGGLDQLKVGLAKAVAGVLQLNTGAGAAYTGSGELADGLVKIDGGAGQLADGAGQLADGTGKLSTGAKQLAGGTQKLRSGSDELAAGAGKLAAGTGDAKDGSGQLADGAGQLADGLGEAADGSGRLADGLHQAASGAPAIRDGATRLSDEGMSKLIGAGRDTAQDYGKLYAVIGAGAERADAERMAYGAPENARGLTAYSFELVGDDGEGGRNTTRGLAAAVLLGLGLAALGLRRRFA
jgi:putative membrane protein